MHESLVVRPISWWLEHLPPERGEFVIVIAPPATDSERLSTTPDDTLGANTFGHLTEIAGLDRREALKETGRRHGISPREVFAALERAKNLG